MSVNVIHENDVRLLEKAQEIADLLQRAIKLGYTISMPPEQMNIVVEIMECADLIKIKKERNEQL